MHAGVIYTKTLHHGNWLLVVPAAVSGCYYNVGEERMSVCWRNGSKAEEGGGGVWFEVLSMSQGKGPKGKAVFLLISTMQVPMYRNGCSTCPI